MKVYANALIYMGFSVLMHLWAFVLNVGSICSVTQTCTHTYTCYVTIFYGEDA